MSSKKLRKWKRNKLQEMNNITLAVYTSILQVVCTLAPPLRPTCMENSWAKEGSCNLIIQGWEFAHSISERIARLLSKMSEWAIHSKKWAIHSFAHFWWGKWAIHSHRSFPLSHLSKSLMVALFWWVKWAIHSPRSCDLSEMSDSLTSLTKKEGMSENARFTHCFNFFKPYVKHSKTRF